MNRQSWWVGVLLGVVGCALLRGGISAEETATQKTPPRVVYTLTIADEIITPTIAEYIAHGLAEAHAHHAEAVILILDTPGGLLESTQRIVRDLMNAELPVVVYVAPSGGRAASAGMFITLAAHVAAMAPSTRIGAAHPVTIGGASPGGERPSEMAPSPPTSAAEKKRRGTKKKSDRSQHDSTSAPDLHAAADPMGDKIMQDTVAWVKGIATGRGRNVPWAISAVTESRSATTDEAKRLGVIDLVATSVEDLLQQLHGRNVAVGSTTQTLQTDGATVMAIAMTVRQQLLQVISNPNIAYILMMLGFYGLLFEITHPGGWIPGIAGTICLLLAFYALHTLPTNYAGIAFIVLGVLLFLVELKVTSYGFLTAAGIGCLAFGSMILIDSPAEFLQISLSVIIPVVVATAMVALLLGYLVIRAQRGHVAVGIEGMTGRIAVVDRPFTPRGKVTIDGEIWDAEGETSAQVGEEVDVVRVEGMRLIVRRRT
ncbi:MAG: nodulation protein NfeD [Deltaproteobacteria bacterium]|nr:nodulation protein NfeD [Deltaproteobacteria bacterium]